MAGGSRPGAWGDLRDIEGPEVVGAKAGNLAKHLRSAEGRDVDLVIIYTPPADTREARLGIKHSDRVLIPARPDLWDLPRWLELFRETAHERCPPVAAAFLLDIAERMAENMSFGLDARDQRTKATE